MAKIYYLINHIFLLLIKIIIIIILDVFQPLPNFSIVNKFSEKMREKEGFGNHGTVVLGINDKLATYNVNGKISILTGPSTYVTEGSSYHFLEKFIVNQDQFICIEKNDGDVEYIKGPTIIYDNPETFKDVHVYNAIKLLTHEALVIYETENDNVIRKIITGPTMFTPSKHGSWIHNFSWHGSSKEFPTIKNPNALNFIKLKISPGQMFYNVTDVRTKDDAMITVKLAIFYELYDTQKMLDNSNDVIADLINGATSDIVHFVGNNTFESFKNKTELLNNLAIYSNLKDRADKIGYHVTQVAFRGFICSDSLEQLQNNAIAQRTKFLLDKENELQNQELANIKLDQEIKRSKTKFELERAEMDNKLNMKKENDSWDLQTIENKNNEQVKHFLKLQELGVNINALLLTKEMKPSKLIKIENNSNDSLNFRNELIMDNKI